jgi:hypothetical protein
MQINTFLYRPTAGVAENSALRQLYSLPSNSSRLYIAHQQNQFYLNVEDKLMVSS